MCCARDSKTLTCLLRLLWTVAEDPGASMWVLDSASQCHYFAEETLWPPYPQSKSAAGCYDIGERRNISASSFAANMPFSACLSSFAGKVVKLHW